MATLRECEMANVPKTEGLPKLAGLQWRAEELKGDTPDPEGTERCVQLAEIVTFLLVWGEAGNVRFMPEVLYMITELMLASDPFELVDLYNIKDLTAQRSSNYFLSKIIRPIYNMVFDE